MTSFFTLAIVQSALEVGFIYALVAMALFLSYSVLNIADLSTDNCFILGCAVGSTVALAGHPFLGLFAAMAAGVCSGFVTAFLQTRLGVESILAGIIVNTGLYTINLMAMGFTSNLGILLGNALGGINHNHTDVCPLHCHKGTHDAEFFNFFVNLGLLADTCRINQ